MTIRTCIEPARFWVQEHRADDGWTWGMEYERSQFTSRAECRWILRDLLGAHPPRYGGPGRVFYGPLRIKRVGDLIRVWQSAGRDE